MRRKCMTYAAILGFAMLCMVTGCKNNEEEGKTDEVTKVPSVEENMTGENGKPEQEGYETYTEASVLSAKVAAKSLMPVEKRIPSREDVYEEQNCQVGTYGEDVQFAVETADEITRQLLSEGLFRYGEDGSILPNIAKAYTVNEDFTKYTVYLRKGLRWSDGVVFTADDCLFFYNKMCLPETFGDPLWNCFTVKDEQGKTGKAVFTKVDDYSFQVIFPSSKPEFLTQLLDMGGICFAPEHYHVNLLPEFMGTDAATAKAKEMGFGNTEEMLKKTVTNAWNIPGVPTLNPFVISEEEGKSNVKGEYYEFVRNPYYWKVDKKGKQLPYLDRMGFTRISGESQKMLLTTEGFLSVSVLNPEQIAEAKTGTERGEYRIITWTDSVSYAVKNKLKNFPEQCPAEAKVRGLGAAHVECWYQE